MRLNQLGAVHFFFAPQTRNQIIDRTDGDEAYPAQSAGVYVADSPVGVVAQRIHRFNRHHRTFKGRHTVERQRHHQEFQNRIGAQFVPCAGKGHNTVDHTAPRRCKQNQRQHHTQRLRPVGQSGVVQMVRTRPHIGENQRPEVHHRQTVRIHRTTGLLGYEVIHHTKEGRSQEKAHGIVAVPPLHHGINRTRINRVGFHHA